MTQFQFPDRRGAISLLAVLMMVFSAVLGSFVLNMGGASQQRAESIPQVNFDFESDGSGTVTIAHSGGDTVRRSAIEIRSPGTTGEWDEIEPNGEIAAGDEIRVTGLESGDTVQLVWESPDSDVTVTLAAYEVP